MKQTCSVVKSNEATIILNTLWASGRQRCNSVILDAADLQYIQHFYKDYESCLDESCLKKARNMCYVFTEYQSVSMSFLSDCRFVGL